MKAVTLKVGCVISVVRMRTLESFTRLANASGN